MQSLGVITQGFFIGEKMRLRHSTEEGLFPGSLAISLGLHGVLAALVLLWGVMPKHTTPSVLTVSLVAPALEAASGSAPPGPGKAPASSGVRTAKAPTPSPAMAPPAKKPSPAVKKKRRKQRVPPLPRPQPEMVTPKPRVRPAPPPVAKAPLTSPSRHHVSASSPSARGTSGAAGGSSAPAGTRAGGGSGTPSTAVLGYGRGGTGGGGNPVQAQKNYLKLIRTRILARRAYPHLARRRHQEGVVRLRFTLSPAGALSRGVRVVKPSGFRLLDDQARQCVLAAVPFPPFPPDLRRDRLTVEVPIVYELTDGGR